ncbi:hypothetical protein A0J48_004430 [Sphaerospermopsis aphanizomenoides BCCUSP55]|uniref:hypothetical protein n=1 Tax=Sphaerospermopsis aphanizomenoides TaxID=459663 RepID=UPI000AD1C40C|nr:hypothetical protein [Sphaerospermopsis aphanizomenoides]MBK1986796.1 hypothetical protein [Sphaerospermopsis aphanizomenoides BCCUSP55]
MKLKILKVLTVSLVTLAVLSPGIIVFNLIWGRHIELVKTQNLSCQFSNINKGYDPLSLQPKSINKPESPTNIKLSQPNFFMQLQILAEQYKLATIWQWLVLGTPICIGFGILGYDRYVVYRAAVLKAQIEMLERLWQQSIEQ